MERQTPRTHVSILGILRPKWQHPSPEVRAAAVATLTDQALLADIVVEDESESVRLAALARLTSQSALARIAKSNSPFNARAFGGLTDEGQIVDVARTAEAPRLRRLAVDQIDDTVVLQQIATVDADVAVRRDATTRRFRLGTDPMRDFLARVLSGLQVAEPGTDPAAEIFGDFDDVCGTLIGDRRFRINGVLTERKEEAGGADASPAGHCYVELLAAKCDGNGEVVSDIHSSAHYRIKIWRMGPETYHASVVLRRC